MAGPWERYSQQPQPEGPWSRYGSTGTEPARPPEDVVAEVGDGRVVRTPDGSLAYTSPGYSTTDPARIEEIMAGSEPGMNLTPGEQIANAAVTAARPVSNFAAGIGEGALGLLGFPIDILNAAPMLPNILPGEQGFRPMTAQLTEIEATPEADRTFSDRITRALFYGLGGAGVTPRTLEDGSVVPAGGGQSLRESAGRAIETVAPNVYNSPAFDRVTRADRFGRRIGEEIGFSAIPLAGATSVALRSGSPVARQAASRLAGNEIAVATASGASAQTANEIAELLGFAPADDDMVGTPTSDVVGSLAGSLGGPVVAGVARSGQRLATGGAGAVADSARQSIAGDMIGRSDAYRDHLARGGTFDNFDTTDLANRLDAPSPTEQMVPGYQAGMGERTGDVGLTSYEDALAGADDAARARTTLRTRDNNTAVNDFLNSTAPQGDPAAFRQAIEADVTARLGNAASDVSTAQSAFDQAAARIAVLEDMAPASVRGSIIQQGLRDVYDAELQKVSDLFQEVERAGLGLDVGPLRERFDAITADLPLNDQRRFQPPETGTAASLAPEVGPQQSSLLGPNGQPMMRPPQNPTQSIDEVTSIRSGLSNRNLEATQPRAGGVARQYRDAVDEYLDQFLPPDQRDQLRQAGQIRADAGRRFESNDVIGRAVAQDGRGQFRNSPESLPAQTVPSGPANVQNYRRVMEEAGSNPAVRGAISDTVAMRAARFLDDPEGMRRFIAENNVVLDDFPGLKGRLESAGASREALNAAQQASDDLVGQIGPRGTAAEGRLLNRNGQPQTAVEGLENVIRNSTEGNVGDEIRALSRSAGSSPEAVAGLRAGMWDAIWRSSGVDRAASMAGEVPTVSFARRLRNAMQDPKINAALDAIPGGRDDFDALQQVFEALESARPGQVRSASNPSGTAASAALQRGGALSPARLSADMRAVGQNRTSILQVGVQWLADGLRNMRAGQQEAWINEMMQAVSNEPGALADILREYNPAVMRFSNMNLTGYRGVRGSQVQALLQELSTFTEEGDEEGTGDETVDAIMRGGAQ